MPAPLELLYILSQQTPITGAAAARPEAADWPEPA